jgi:tetratricopeptide (TPR) repeat protein
VESSEYAIAIDPDDPEALVSKANGLYRLGNYEEALEYFRRYSERMPDDEYGLMHQGVCLINMGRNEEAIDILKKAIDIAGEDSGYLSDIYQELAFAYNEKGDTDKALEYLDATDQLECDHVQLTVVKGHVLLSAGRVEEAEDYFRQAVSQSDNAPQTLMRIIVSLYDNRYVEASYKMFLKFFKIVEKDFNEGYAYMALCCYELKKYDEFLKYLKIACQRNPHECQLVLSHLFPADLKPEQYYEYIKNKMSAQ